MAMGAAKGDAATLQVEMVCLDELVPEDDRYRRLDELVDWSFVREGAAPYYADELGRPSLDPIVLVKLMLAGALEGIGSVRELLRVAALRIDLRRFLGYGFCDRLPVHQTISHAHIRRFVDAQLFERLFARSVSLCKEHDLLDGTHLSIDGFHSEADAALSSLRASLALAPAPEQAAAPDAQGEDEPEPRERPQLQIAEPRSGPTPRRRSSNQTSTSKTDPDSKLRAKPGQRPHLVHRGQVAVDPKARCVVACLGEQADGHEGDAVAPLHERARFHCPELASVSADQGFAAERVWTDAASRGLTALIPPQPTMLPSDGEPRSEAQRQALLARKRCKSELGVWAHKRRMADAEGVISELKTQGTLARARCRGTPLFHLQLLVDCAAVNMKRLADHAGEAAEGRTGPATGALFTPAGVQAPCEAANARLGAATGARAHVPIPSDARIASIWSFAVSLN
ncbi:MAG: transposase [Actinomycetota bacterium]|nr:transposase [Actinomycetota bacterium]